MKSFLVILGTALLTCAFCQTTLAQNRNLVEKSVENLDKINREALKQVPDKPRDGTIRIKGKGSQRGDDIKIDIERYEVAPVQEGSIQLDGRTSGSKSVDKENHDEQ